ncbi:2-dehydro-3-deoxygluconokinase [Gracilibacillus orientalis]|uniref:2-dehydro-3-deoxygluconokinase n=1 Tax=Gracilibacillus orientalis TaxID=334253 RepID=A0A1I4HY27_9BACI|nr:sugar kinase [Gracilibacillus orientalis]SFL47042.1 2-dehydro-3-deoxygluconokinase [Gracilibacillus orientalis]
MSDNIAAYGEVMMRLEVPGYHLLSQSDTLSYTFSGTGVNICGSLSKLGHKGMLITTLPENTMGDTALAYLRKLGIDTQYVNRNGNYIGMYFLENGFGVRPPRVTYSNRLESSFNTTQYESDYVEHIAKNINFIHFCGISLAMNDTVRNQMKHLALLVKERGGTVFFDCNYRPSLWGENGHSKAEPHYEDMLRLADIVIMNEKDAIHTLGFETTAHNEREKLTSLIPLVAKEYNISIIAGTRRSVHTENKHSIQGYMYKEKIFHFSNQKTFNVLDRIGTGDAFASGIIHGECNAYSSEDTINFATSAAVLAHTTKGDTPMSTERDIISLMSHKNHDVIR